MAITKNPENLHTDGSKPSGDQSRLQLLSWPQVQTLLAGRSASSVRRDELAGRFPARIKVGPRQIGWYEHEVRNFLLNLPRVAGNDPDEK